MTMRMLMLMMMMMSWGIGSNERMNKFNILISGRLSNAMPCILEAITDAIIGVSGARDRAAPRIPRNGHQDIIMDATHRTSSKGFLYM